MLNASFTPKSFSNITGGHLKNIGSLSYANISNFDVIDPPWKGYKIPRVPGTAFLIAIALLEQIFCFFSSARIFQLVGQ